MSKIRKNDIVCRKSYGGDILFSVDKIIKSTRGKQYAILKRSDSSNCGRCTTSLVTTDMNRDVTIDEEIYGDMVLIMSTTINRG